VKPRLAFVSPIPPVRSGIADYARDLLPLLASEFDIEVFVDVRHPVLAAGRYGGLTVRSAPELRRRFGEYRYVVYQMGNNLHHRFVLELAADLPGIVVLHDLVLHHLYEEIAGLEDEWEAYGLALRRSYGAAGDVILRTKRWRMAAERENFAFPLFESLAAASRGVIVHNDSARREVERRLPLVPVRRIAMGIPQEPELDREGARARLGIRAHDVVVGAFGFLTPIKRLDVLAAALRGARQEFAGLRLVLVGEASPGLRVEDLFTAEELASGQVSHRGYVSGEEYRDWMAATDVAVNLRYPTAGETSASLLRLLGDGKCTLVSAYRQFLEIPAGAVVRIPLGRAEETALTRELIALARDPARRARVGEAARSFVATEHSMEAAARAFGPALREIGDSPPLGKLLPSPLWRCAKTSRSAGIRGVARPAGAEEVQLAAGSAAAICLIVRNEGDSRWISTPEATGGYVGVGADLARVDGTLVARLRPTLLRGDLDPEAETPVALSVNGRLEPGEYRLQPTLVHFGRGARITAGRPLSLRVVAPRG
jgi:glycosyltransferase involved in cell wall biosynthesis